MIWENGIETCILSCKKRITSLGSMQDTGCLGLVHWDDPERWYGEGGGRGVQDWELMYTRGILSPCLFNLYAEYIMRNAGLEKAQAGIKIDGRNINNLRHADDTTLVAK